MRNKEVSEIQQEAVWNSYVDNFVVEFAIQEDDTKAHTDYNGAR